VISDDAAMYANFTQSQKCWAHFLRKAIKLTLMEPANVEYRQRPAGEAVVQAIGRVGLAESRFILEVDAKPPIGMGWHRFSSWRNCTANLRRGRCGRSWPLAG